MPSAALDPELSTSYKLGLDAQTITNQYLTLNQPLALPCSLKMVSANPAKELQNVLPNGHPFAAQIEYHINGAAFAPLALLLWGKGLGVRGMLANLARQPPIGDAANAAIAAISRLITGFYGDKTAMSAIKSTSVIF